MIVPALAGRHFIFNQNKPGGGVGGWRGHRNTCRAVTKTIITMKIFPVEKRSPEFCTTRMFCTCALWLQSSLPVWSPRQCACLSTVIADSDSRALQPKQENRSASARSAREARYNIQSPACCSFPAETEGKNGVARLPHKFTTNTGA